MVGLLIKALRSVPVKDGPAEGHAFHRVAVAPGRAMPPGQNELESAGAGLAEQGDGIVPQPARILVDVVEDLVRELRVVQVAENLGNHRLLVGCKEFANLDGRDVPVVVHLGLEGMTERKRDLLSLLGSQALVERGDQRLRPLAEIGFARDARGSPLDDRDRRRCCQADASHGHRFQKTSTVEFVAVRASHGFHLPYWVCGLSMSQFPRDRLPSPPGTGPARGKPRHSRLRAYRRSNPNNTPSRPGAVPPSKSAGVPREAHADFMRRSRTSLTLRLPSA